MIHLEEGRLRALLDEELPDEEARDARAHLVACVACDVALRRVEETQVLATALLDALDEPAPVARVRARLAARRMPAQPRARLRWLGGGDLAKAALLLLGFSGAVAAAVHPASPLRRLFVSEAPVTSASAPAADAAERTAATAAVREVGVRLAVAGGGVRVALASAATGTPIEVTWVDDGAAAVYAPEGTQFSTSDAEGRIDATLSAGPVRVELPRTASRASLTVDGATYLAKTGERIDYPGPPALVEGPRARFEVR